MSAIYTYGEYGEGFELGERVFSIDGTVLKIERVPSIKENTFEAMDLKTGEYSAWWDRNKFRRIIASRQNIFRDPITGRLNKIFLRHCAVYKLLKIKKIDKSRAVNLLLCGKNIRQATVEIMIESITNECHTI